MFFDIGRSCLSSNITLFGKIAYVFDCACHIGILCFRFPISWDAIFFWTQHNIILRPCPIADGKAKGWGCKRPISNRRTEKEEIVEHCSAKLPMFSHTQQRALGHGQDEVQVQASRMPPPRWQPQPKPFPMFQLGTTKSIGMGHGQEQACAIRIGPHPPAPRTAKA